MCGTKELDARGGVGVDSMSCYEGDVRSGPASQCSKLAAMANMRDGSFHLTRVAGIDLYLHWSWFVVAVIEIQWRGRSYHSIVWNVLEYLALFSIVLTHEFGHALACRQVGGTANKIMLWPLGGVAYVDPPQRPGATLWSIAAGPLVNVALLPVLFGAWWAAETLGWPQSAPDVYAFIGSLAWMNVVLLGFNILPVYPLDGGQMLRSLLWFWLGKARSLMVAAAIGVVGVVGLAVLGVAQGSVWTLLMAAYLLMSCWGGLKTARALMKIEKLPRRTGFACPSCKTSPPLGDFWKCDQCGQGFDTFASGAVCPHCKAQYPITACGDCGRASAMTEWVDKQPWISGTVLERR